MPIDYDSEILRQSRLLLEYSGDKLRANDPRDGAWTWLPRCYDNAGSDHISYQLRWHGIPYDPKFWLDRSLTAAERQGFSRAMRQLASLGLIKAVARFGGSRVSHFTLTPGGLRVAIKLAADVDESLDVQAVAIALRHCKWATDEHHGVVAAQEEPKA